MKNFLQIVENSYKASASSINSNMSVIKVRLDISNLLSTNKKAEAVRSIAWLFLWAVIQHHFIIPAGDSQLGW